MGISVYTSLLIKDYKRKAGEIKALRKDLRELAKETLRRERELASIAMVLKTREPEICLDNLKPIATYRKVSGLKWNLLTKLIFACLKEADGNPVSSLDYIRVKIYLNFCALKFTISCPA